MKSKSQGDDTRNRTWSSRIWAEWACRYTISPFSTSDRTRTDTDLPVQGILSPSRAANFATEAFRADGGTRTPDVCVPTYKVGAVATVPHQHFWGPDWIRTSVTDFAELYLSYFYTTRPRDHLLLDWSVTIRLSSRYQRDAFPIKLQSNFILYTRPVTIRLYLACKTSAFPIKLRVLLVPEVGLEPTRHIDTSF